MTVFDDEQPARRVASASTVHSRIVIALVANGVSRIGGAAAGALIGFYLNDLVQGGRILDAALIIGLLGVVFSGSELVSALPIGLLSDRFTPRALLVAGALLAAAATQIFGLSVAIAAFAVARALQGFAAATSGPALLAFLTDITGDDHALRGRTMAFYELSLLGGLALGGLVGGGLWEAIGTTAFTVLALVYLLGGALFFWSTAPVAGAARASKHSELAGLLGAFRDPLLRRMAPAWLAMNAIIGMWLTHIIVQLTGAQIAGQYLVGRFSPSESGLVLLVYAILFAVGAVAWGYALAYVPRLRALRISMVALALTVGALFLLNASEGWPVWLRWLVVGVTGVLIAVESGFTPAALAYLADIAGQSSGRGAAMGIYTLLLGLGSAIGAGVGGWLASALAFNGLLLGTITLLAFAFVALSLLPSDPVKRPAHS